MATSQTQIFLDLRIAGNRILGEATIADYEDQIEIDSFKFQVKAKATSPKQGTKLSTRVEPSVLTLSKLFDRSSANLARYAARQTEFDHAKITVNQHQTGTGGAQAMPVLVIELWEGVVKNLSLSMSGSSGSSSLREDIELSYKEVSLDMHASTADRQGRRAATNFNVRVKGSDE